MRRARGRANARLPEREALSLDLEPARVELDVDALVQLVLVLLEDPLAGRHAVDAEDDGPDGMAVRDDGQARREHELGQVEAGGRGRVLADGRRELDEVADGDGRRRLGSINLWGGTSTQDSGQRAEGLAGGSVGRGSWSWSCRERERRT